MSLEKVMCGAFVVVARTLNIGFFIGELDNPQHHHELQLAATVVVNLIAMTLKFGDRILFAGNAGVEGLQRRTLNDDGAVHYLRTGREPVRTWLGRLLAGRAHGDVSAPRTLEPRRP